MLWHCLLVCPSSDDLGHESLLGNGGSGSLMVQSKPRADGASRAAHLDRLGLDLLPFAEDVFRPAEVDIGRGEVAEAFVVTLLVVVLDEGSVCLLEGSGQVVVLEQDPVLQRLVPALDPALGLRVVGRAADVVNTFLVDLASWLNCAKPTALARP